MHDKMKPPTASQSARQIDQSAIDKWYNEEWEKQLRNSGHAKEAYDLLALLKTGNIISVPDGEYKKIRAAVDTINSIIFPYTEKRFDGVDFVVSWDDDCKASELINSLDEIEKAAYDQISMEIIAGNKKLANPASMICFVITNHFWRLCGGNLYGYWNRPYLSWRRADGLGRLSEIMRGEIMEIVNLAAKGWHNYFPFEETISLPPQFCK